jgi:hypothetical protein
VSFIRTNTVFLFEQIVNKHKNEFLLIPLIIQATFGALADTVAAALGERFKAVGRVFHCQIERLYDALGGLIKNPC